MKHILYLFLLFCLPIEMEAQIKCHIEGTVINRPKSNTLVLIETNADPRIASTKYISIRDGHFVFDFSTDKVKAYDLIFKEELDEGAMWPVTFFAENGGVRFTLYPSNAQPRYIISSKNPVMNEMLAFNRRHDQVYLPKYKRLGAEMDSLDKAQKFYNEKQLAFVKRLEAASEEEKVDLYKVGERMQENGEFYTLEGKNVTSRYKELVQQETEEKINYISKHTTLFSLYLISNLVCFNPTFDKYKIASIYNKTFSRRFAGHPYINMINTGFQANALKVGNVYPNYVTNDLKGQTHHISDLIRGKIAIIDLWASWCGPCRIHSKQLIPVYEKFKNHGFTVIAIAREKGNTENMESAVKKDGYPWQQYIELNDKNQIWNRHGIGLSGGGIFLVDSDNRLLAINPDIEEVEKILEERLK